MFSAVAESVTDANLLPLFSLANTLGSEKLSHSLEDLLISEKYLKKESATRFLHEGVRFGRDRLKQAALEVITANFEEIQAKE